jgi:hypothetical protein
VLHEKLKEKFGATLRDSLFVGMTRAEEFVSSKFPQKFASDVYMLDF